MLSLGLDTTGRWCTAALVDHGRVLASAAEPLGRGHAERLAPMVQEVFQRAHRAPRDLDRVAVCTGPGSFTGQRVALSFAKGLALPRRLPVIGLNALEIQAAQADPDQTRRVLSVINVKRGELCWGFYHAGQIVRQPITEPLETAQTHIQSLTFDAVVGDGAELIGLNADITRVSGPVLAWLAQDKRPEDYPADALYSRAPDAKLPGGIAP